MILLIILSCSPYRKLKLIRSGEVSLDISVPDNDISPAPTFHEVEPGRIDCDVQDGPIILNAIRDDETGEMVATDVISASTVVARFRNVAERNGCVTISFDVMIPSEMSDSDWQLKLTPHMMIQEDTIALNSLYITGRHYREKQLRGYQRYNEFVASIIRDTSDMIRTGQLEIFLERHFPDTYAMKTDSSFISDPVAENYFGVSQTEALRHYTRHLKVLRNERRKSRADMMYRRYVPDPILSEGVRLDTVLNDEGGDMIYRYNHTFRSRPGLKKVTVSMDGEICQDGHVLQHLPFQSELTYYISSLSTLADMSDKYLTIVKERNRYDNTKAFIDFRQGSSEIDTSLSDNASELSRIVRCIGNVASRRELVLDSLVIVSSCSPEGLYSHNSRLSLARSEAVRKQIWPYLPVEWRDSVKTSSVPENWDQLRLLVANDTVMTERSKSLMLDEMIDVSSPDEVESRLSGMKGYRYLREKLYPKLRSVSFDFYLHRAGMQKDTVHTTELDTAYMAGVEALKAMDYKLAVEKLRPYEDYNSAVALLSAGYDNSALDVLDGLGYEDSAICYLKALALSRLERWDEAQRCYEKGLSMDPNLKFRANLDPEMSYLLEHIITNKNL